jgi:glycosyltransferase involved in cell wall biosynthesis
VGTYHNSRKGLDLVAKAFSEEFKKNEKIKLLFKVNKIYSPGEGFNKYILPFINQEGNTNIEFIDTDLSEEELSEIFAVADTYVSPHRSEGFGINILNSLAIGTPVIATQATGNLDICNEDVALMVKVQEVRWAPYITPYERSKWAEPSIQSLKEQMRLAFKGHKTFKKIALGNADKVREVLSWSRVADMIEARVAQIVK